MHFTDLADLTPERRLALEAATASHHILERVVRWGYAQQPMIEISDVIVQDEFTHDVIVPLPDGLFLVYDST
ncbi:MAG: hypothetical protein H6741_12780 [Alphaproteobacteria bacterium]|nr:hypothetical protein [Alphaproteobacteria bacterium]